MSTQQCNPVIKTKFYISVPTCAVPDGATLNSGHVIESTPGAGNIFTEGDTVTFTCDPVWVHPNGNVSRSFTCTCMDAVTPDWTYCTGQ